jgi:subtilisin family serine protease
MQAYFDVEGNRIKPIKRKKPEITAPDGGNTSFFPPSIYFGNQDITADADTFPNFFGTSAAAPHAAGVAALMIEAQKLGTITPDQIKGVLTKNAIDMNNRYTRGFDKGFDYNTGHGFLQADKAVGAVQYRAKCGQDIVLERNSDQSISSRANAKTTDKPNAVQIFPNPSKTNFKVSLALDKPKNINITLYSTEGKVLYQKTGLANGVIDINASNYSPGLYILNVRQGEFSKTFKLIKQ